MNIESNNSSIIYAQISIGELIDKITILKIKQHKMKGNQLKNVNKELILLETIVKENHINIAKDLFDNLQEINSNLWEIEDQIRVKEKKQEFDKDFIELARSVYIQNDKRSLIKKNINTKYNSEIFEEKSYQK
tara:strand:- start:2039 stop:2437 length:399 start_codon:yes stop_codon:yes gene_type:complete